MAVLRSTLDAKGRTLCVVLFSGKTKEYLKPLILKFPSLLFIFLFVRLVTFDIMCSDVFN
jgi:hypothetical protein